MSLVSVWARNWTQTAEIGEAVETGEIVEIVNTDAVFMQVAEKMAGCSKGLGEYPTILDRPRDVLGEPQADAVPLGFRGPLILRVLPGALRGYGKNGEF